VVSDDAESYARSTMPRRGHDPDSRLRQLVAEQAALRRVATLVARGAGPGEVFSATSSEVGQLFGAECAIARFEPDGSSMVVVGLTKGIPVVTVGTRWELEDFLASTEVYRTGEPARNDHAGYRTSSGPVADSLRRMSFVSTVAAPITVEGRLWGVMTVSDARKALPPGTEDRVGKFTELVATAIANAASRAELSASEQRAQHLARGQAALRRVATLVARGVSQEEIFSAVSHEVGMLFGADPCICRFEADGSSMVVVGVTETTPVVSIGMRLQLEDFLSSTTVYRTGRPARNDHRAVRNASGPVADILNKANYACTVSAPIVVQGSLWGVMTLSHADEPLPPDTEDRLERFTDLVAVAIANAKSRGELAASEERAHALAQEQAALRRVATLVAEGASAEEVLSAVAKEVGDALDMPIVTICRHEPDGFVVLRTAPELPGFPAGSRWPSDVPSLPRLIYETGRPARIDDFTNATGLNAAVRDAAGVKAAVGVPIEVAGTAWGSICAVTTKSEPIPPDAEGRLSRFCDLVATSISNTIMREELAASRARVIAAADDARRQIERDLHDGAQQRLVTLTVALRRAAAHVPSGSGELRAEVNRIAEGLITAVEELRELSQGIHPAELTEGGLSPALKALGRRSAIRVELDVPFDDRLPDQVEVAAYYTVSEALTNASKHSGAKRVRVSLDLADDLLRFSIRDDGIGGADASLGSGLTGLRDRIEALGGRLRIESPRGRGTSIEVEIPAGQSKDQAGQRAKRPSPAVVRGLFS
jgi:signal transduction histidine kinase/CBS domain-containing protein